MRGDVAAVRCDGGWVYGVFCDTLEGGVVVDVDGGGWEEKMCEEGEESYDA